MSYLAFKMDLGLPQELPFPMTPQESLQPYLDDQMDIDLRAPSPYSHRGYLFVGTSTLEPAVIQVQAATN